LPSTRSLYYVRSTYRVQALVLGGKHRAGKWQCIHPINPGRNNNSLTIILFARAPAGRGHQTYYYIRRISTQHVRTTSVAVSTTPSFTCPSSSEGKGEGKRGRGANSNWKFHYHAARSNPQVRRVLADMQARLFGA
jgi:hypothetical protein